MIVNLATADTALDWSAQFIRTTRQSTERKANASQAQKTDSTNQDETKAKSTDGEQLTTEEQKLVAELKKTDSKVKAHEAAHMTAGAGLILSGPDYSFQRGPDGQLYAVGGDVTIDTSEVPDDAKATANKMERVVTAALAPADPSPQDRRVAADARSKEVEARLAEAQEKLKISTHSRTSSNEGTRREGVRQYSKATSTLAASRDSMLDALA